MPAIPGIAPEDLRTPIDRDVAAALVNSRNWYHSFEVLPGLVTPGQQPTDARKILNDRFSLSENLAGKRVLDVGALDGAYSFELERRGADVTAIDIQNPDKTGFNIAKKVIGSSVRYIQGNVCYLSNYELGTFDIILFFGVWYHLKNPMSAFEQVSRALSSNGLLLFEGECLLNHAEHDRMDKAALLQAARTFADSELPISIFYAGSYKNDPYNWYVPNKACVNEWLKAASLEMTSHGFWDKFPHQRMYGVAKKRSGTILVDNPVW